MDFERNPKESLAMRGPSKAASTRFEPFLDGVVQRTETPLEKFPSGPLFQAHYIHLTPATPKFRPRQGDQRGGEIQMPKSARVSGSQSCLVRAGFGVLIFAPVRMDVNMLVHRIFVSAKCAVGSSAYKCSQGKRRNPDTRQGQAIPNPLFLIALLLYSQHASPGTVSRVLEPFCALPTWQGGCNSAVYVSFITLRLPTHFCTHAVQEPITVSQCPARMF